MAAGRVKDLMIGDAYAVDVAGNATRVTAAGNTLRGVVEGIDLRPIAASAQGPVSQDFIPAADAGAIIGIEDPEQEFIVQIDTFSAATNVGVTAAVVDADGDQALRQSRQSIVVDAVNQQMRIIELLNSPADNAAGAFARVVVRLLQTM